MALLSDFSNVSGLTPEQRQEYGERYGSYLNQLTPQTRSDYLSAVQQYGPEYVPHLMGGLLPGSLGGYVAPPTPVYFNMDEGLKGLPPGAVETGNQEGGGGYAVPDPFQSKLTTTEDELNALRQAGYAPVSRAVEGWGTDRTEPEEGKAYYKDPSQFRFDPRFGLITPLSNYLPAKPEDDWFGTFMDDYFPYLYMATMSALGGGLGGAAAGAAGASGVGAGMASGAASGATTAAISDKPILQGALTGAALGGITGGMTEYVPTTGSDVADAALRRATVGGVKSAMTGGDVGEGALSGALGPLSPLARMAGILPEGQQTPTPAPRRTTMPYAAPSGGGALSLLGPSAAQRQVQASGPQRVQVPGGGGGGLGLGGLSGLGGLR